MSRLIAYMGSDPERLRTALQDHRELLFDKTPAGAGDTIACCGAGFYQGGEVLLQRRPRLPPGPFDLFEALKELRTDALLAQVAQGVESRLAKNENTPPYRFRSWIMVHEGGAPGFSKPREELQPLIPDFLKRNIRGQTASEQLFHLFLASLHEAGRGQLEDANLPPELSLAAFQRAYGRLREVVGDELEGSDLQVALTNGRSLTVVRRGPRPLWLRRIAPTTPERERGHDPFRAVLALSGPELDGPLGSFEEVPSGHALLVGRDLVPRVVAL